MDIQTAQMLEYQRQLKHQKQMYRRGLTMYARLMLAAVRMAELRLYKHTRFGEPLPRNIGANDKARLDWHHLLAKPMLARLRRA